MKQQKPPLPSYLRVVLREPIRIIIGPAELEHLLAGEVVGFHIDAIDIKVALDKPMLDPPEVKELVSTYRRRPR